MHFSQPARLRRSSRPAAGLPALSACRWVDADGNESFGHLTPHPETEGIYGTSATLADYVGQQGVAPFFDMGDRYGAVYQRMIDVLESSMPRTRSGAPTGERCRRDGRWRGSLAVDRYRQDRRRFLQSRRESSTQRHRWGYCSSYRGYRVMGRLALLIVSPLSAIL